MKFSGVTPLLYESSQFTARHTSITKKRSKYIRKNLYQIIHHVIALYLNNTINYRFLRVKVIVVLKNIV
ncbi:transposase [Thomasclavelia spiroformis]|uniref:transposase n=1 Tax=Thomasclavelia spiroformis TaxID=29348 RepID=UPI000B389B50|nr:transposase [Thomasclavelia spiroformis]OUO70329.1 hypothetical protein B5F64_06550 [Thomasclavelia spiroformis]